MGTIQEYYTEFPTIGLALDLSRSQIADDFLKSMDLRMQELFAGMAALEAAAISNRDEGSMVGYYWLRRPTLAPISEIRMETEIGPELGRTLCLVISKSSRTKETRGGMLEAKGVYEERGYQSRQTAVAVTQKASELDADTTKYGWLRTFPIWDWIGGSTSELSVLELLTAALQGFDIECLIDRASACDDFTHRNSTLANPAPLLALSWFHAGRANVTWW